RVAACLLLRGDGHTAKKGRSADRWVAACASPGPPYQTSSPLHGRQNGPAAGSIAQALVSSHRARDSGNWGIAPGSLPPVRRRLLPVLPARNLHPCAPESVPKACLSVPYVRARKSRWSLENAANRSLPIDPLK